MRYDTSFARVSFLVILVALAIVVGLCLTTLVHSAPPTPAPEEHAVAAVVIAVDGEPRVVVFVSQTGKRLTGTTAACKAAPACLQLFTQLRAANAVDMINIPSETPAKPADHRMITRFDSRF